MSVLIATSLGDLVVDLFTDRCPMTCKNFLKLCKIKYYNGCLFHTVQKDFTAQTGDPTGTGSGGDSVYKFLYGDQARFFGDEIHLDVKHSKTGTVAMASAGENMNASQFYVTLRDDLDYLDGKHTVFGEVAEGLETLARINEAYVDEKSKPYKNIRIKHTYILDDPFEDPAQLSELIPDASPEGKPKDEVDDDVRLEDDWVPMDEQLNAQELEEVLRAKNAHSSAVVLETIGDIPDAEVKPPDNVLFVCKLNPVTEDEDLHTIFSRFGVVTSAEIIRDHKTQDSLCYGFIEFEDTEACEQAYFKMDNALIDDRRIHVDFSQSVSRLWNQFRRKGPKGGGCFKCGSLEHIAKDCTGDSTNKQQSKYTLRDDNTQRGGNSRYEMVFEGDAGRSPGHGKRRRDHKVEQQDEKPSGKRPDYQKPRDDDDRRRERHERRSPNPGRERDHKEKYYRRDDVEHTKRHSDDVGSIHKREDKEYEKRRDEAGHRYRRDERNGDDSKKRSIKEDYVRSDDVARKHKRDDKEYVKRGDEASHRYKRDDRNGDDTKKSVKEDDGPSDDVRRKYKTDDREYEKRRGDEATHRYKRDERNDDTQRSIREGDDHHKRRR